MPFGLRNAAQAFQRLMDETCRGLSFEFAYIDDLLVASSDEQEHLAQLEILFQRLQDNGLVINSSKWKFGCTQMEFLDHDLNVHGVSSLANKVQAIMDLPQPTSIKGLQEFVGVVNFCNRFLTKAAQIMLLLYQAIGKKSKSIKTLCGHFP